MSNPVNPVPVQPVPAHQATKKYAYPQLRRVPAQPVPPQTVVAAQPVAAQPVVAPVAPVAAHPAPVVAEPVVAAPVAAPVVAQPVVAAQAPVNPVENPVSPSSDATSAKPVFVVEADGVQVTAVGVGSEQSVLINSVNTEMVRRVENAANFRSTIDLVWGVPITAGWETPEGVVAALLHAAPGRTRLLRAPKETIAALDAIIGPVDPNVVY